MPLTFIRFYVRGKAWLADLTRPTALARPMHFTPEAPTWFGAQPASENPMQSGDFVGCVSRGGSVNASVLTITPHGNGTHTEGVGHITGDAVSVQRAAPSGLIPASVLTVSSGTAAEIERAVAQARTGFLEAVALRAARGPLSLEPEAMRVLVRSGVRHLLVREPSVDPEDDGGALRAHRAFWGVAEGETRGVSPRTITELIQLGGDLADGPYLLNLQVPPLETDAVPSRPILFPVRPA